MFFCLLCSLSVFVAVAYFAGLGRGRAAGLCAGVAFAVAKLRWGSRENLWFWSAISLSLILQAIVIAFVPFGGESMPVTGLVPAGLVIYLVAALPVAHLQMANGRCRMHGGSSTGPRTAKGLERSRRARWKHGHYSAIAKADRRFIRRLIEKSAGLLRKLSADAMG